MSKKMIVFSLSMLTFLPLLPPAYAADSTINIKGYVRDNTCAMAPGSKNQVVDLLASPTKLLRANGDVTSSIPFSIELAPCGSSVTAVKIGFVGIADIQNTTLLAIEPGNLNASGVGIQILDSQKSPLVLNETSNSLNWLPLVAQKSNTIQFYARLMASNVPVTAGHVRATATFTLEFQ
nr:fimbrial protein [Providencia rettgeri]